MESERWVSWRQGTNFVKWHLEDSETTVKCGIQIPAKAAKCYAGDAFVAQYHGGTCVSCRKLLLRERIP